MTEEPSLWSQVLSTYRDVEIAKRAQPRLVQGAQQTSVPFQQNVNAPQTPVDISRSTTNILGLTVNPTLLLGSIVLLVGAVAFKLANK